MTIELKNTDFKELYEWIINHTDISTPVIGEIIHKELKPQYEEAFLKYKDEIQLFKKSEKVWFRKSIRHDWKEGRVYKISRLANGQYKYIISYKESAEDYYENGDEVDGDEVDGDRMVTGLMTKKNIKKYEKSKV